MDCLPFRATATATALPLSSLSKSDKRISGHGRTVWSVYYNENTTEFAPDFRSFIFLYFLRLISHLITNIYLTDKSSIEFRQPELIQQKNFFAVHGSKNIHKIIAKTGTAGSNKPEKHYDKCIPYHLRHKSSE